MKVMQFVLIWEIGFARSCGKDKERVVIICTLAAVKHHVPQTTELQDAEPTSQPDFDIRALEQNSQPSSNHSFSPGGPYLCNRLYMVAAYIYIYIYIHTYIHIHI